MIKFNNVSKSYSDKQVLKDINLNIIEGEIFGVIGYSGAGKSTLIRTINKIENIDSGNVYVDGIDIHHVGVKELNIARSKIGFVFQNFNLLSNLNVNDNLKLVLKNAKYSKEKINSRIDELLELVGLADHKYKYIHQLSGGQQQRVGIARSLCLEPKVLLCDEATSALDPSTTKQILELLLKINEQLGITMVIITHEMDVIKTICDRVAVIDKGVIIEENDVIDIFRNPQKEITKSLVNSVLNEQKIIKSNDTSYIIKLIYAKNSYESHGLYEITRDLDLDFNIIGGQILTTKQGDYGQTIVEFNSQKDELLAYLEDNNIEYEVVV